MRTDRRKVRHDDANSRFSQFCGHEMLEGMPWIQCLFFLVLDVAHWLNRGIFVDIGRTKRHPDIFVYYMIDYNH
jgi:hypothetical protein